MLTPIPDLLKIITPNQRRIDAEQAKKELEQNKALFIVILILSVCCSTLTIPRCISVCNN